LVVAFEASEPLILAHQEQAVARLSQELLQALLVNDSAQVRTLMDSLAKQPGVATADLVSSQGASLASFAHANPHSTSEQVFALALLEPVSGTTHTTVPLRFDGMVVAQLHVALRVWPVFQVAMMWLGVGLCVMGAFYAVFKHFRFKLQWDTPKTQLPQAVKPPESVQAAPFDLQHALRLALAQAQITVKFQPMHRRHDGAVVGMNVRVCWPQSSGELLHLSAAEFVAQARKEGISLPFGEWVFETAWTQAAQWQRAHGPLILAFDMSEQELAAWNAMGQGACLGAPLDADEFSRLLQAVSPQMAKTALCMSPWPAKRASAA
jgi:hypothetical protein